MPTQATKLPMLHVSNKLYVWFVYIGLIVFTTLVAFGSLRELPLDTHDDEILRDHEIAKEFTYFFLPAAQKEFSAPGRPFSELLRWFGFLLWGNNVATFHAYCVLLHAFASVLLSITAIYIGMSLHASMLGGWLFLLNVSHFRAFHTIVNTDYPLALIWSLCGIISYIKYYHSSSRAMLILACSFFILGIGTHQASIVVVLFLFSWLWINNKNVLHYLYFFIPITLVLLFISYLLLQIADSGGATTHKSLSQLISSSLITTVPSVLRVFFWLVSRLFTTAHWIFFPLYEQKFWEVILGGLIVTVFCYVIYRRVKPISFWMSWVILFIVPFTIVSEEIHINLVHGPSRHLYLATAGSSLVFACILKDLFDFIVKNLKYWGYVAYLLIVFFIGLSSVTFLKKTEALSYYSSGRFYLQKENPTSAVDCFEKAIYKGHSIIPLLDTCHRLSITALNQLDSTIIHDICTQKHAQNEAFRIYKLVYNTTSSDSLISTQSHNKLSMILNSSNANIIAQGFYNLGNGFNKYGNASLAIGAYRKALTFSPNMINGLKALSRSLVIQGDFEEAVRVVNQLIKTDPTDHKMHYVLGQLYLRQGDYNRANQSLQKVLAIAPKSQEALKSTQILSQIK